MSTTVKKMVFKGSLSTDLNISEIIELAGRNMKSGMLAVYGANNSARIYFDNGDIINASCTDKSGIEALADMLCWNQGDFNFEDGVKAGETNVGCNYNAALLNAAKKLDERDFSLDVNLFSNAWEEISMTPLKEQLENFLKIDGIVMVVVVGRDGFIIESAAHSDHNIDDVGAVVSTGMGSSESMGVDLGVGDMHQGMLEYEEGIIFMRAIAEEAILIVVSTPSVNLGMIRLQMKRRIKPIADALP